MEEKYNIVSTQGIVKTGIAELDNEIGGLHIGENTILFGGDREGTDLFLESVKKDACMSPDSSRGWDSVIECRTGRSIVVHECMTRTELPIKEDCLAENIFQITERDGRHYLRVLKNRMNGVHDFECEIR